MIFSWYNESQRETFICRINAFLKIYTSSKFKASKSGDWNVQPYFGKTDSALALDGSHVCSHVQPPGGCSHRVLWVQVEYNYYDV